MFSQHDPNYERLRLGTGKHTIGTQGSLLCCLASILVDIDAIWDPALLNRWLVKSNGYAQGDCLAWIALEPLGLICSSVTEWFDIPAPIDFIREKYVAGCKLLLKVNFDPWGKFKEHWLLLRRLQPEDWYCDDPWIPPGIPCQVGVLSHYAKPSQSLARAVYGAVAYTVKRW